jgi:hypothetical protein
MLIPHYYIRYSLRTALLAEREMSVGAFHNRVILCQSKKYCRCYSEAMSV